VQTVTSHELITQDSGKELRWTALPKPCQKCFGVKRKRVTENDTSESKELSPKVRLMDTNAEHTGGEECPADPVLSGTALTPAEDMLLSAGCSSGTTVSSDRAVCASLNTPSMSTAATSFSRSRSQNTNCLSSTKQQNISKAPQLRFVQPLFKNSVFKEVDSPCSDVPDVKVRDAGNVKKDLDLHRCPLCDMVFDIR